MSKEAASIISQIVSSAHEVFEDSILVKNGTVKVRGDTHVVLCLEHAVYRRLTQAIGHYERDEQSVDNAIHEMAYPPKAPEPPAPPSPSPSPEPIDQVQIEKELLICIQAVADAANEIAVVGRTKDEDVIVDEDDWDELQRVLYAWKTKSEEILGKILSAAKESGNT